MVWTGYKSCHVKTDVKKNWKNLVATDRNGTFFLLFRHASLLALMILLQSSSASSSASSLASLNILHILSVILPEKRVTLNNMKFCPHAPFCSNRKISDGPFHSYGHYIQTTFLNFQVICSAQQMQDIKSETESKRSAILFLRRTLQGA